MMSDEARMFLLDIRNKMENARMQLSIESMPNSREKALVLTKLDEGLMWFEKYYHDMDRKGEI